MLQGSNFKTIKVLDPYASHAKLYRSDCEKIQASLLDHGYYASIEQCAKLWELYSEEYAAGWLAMSEKGEEIYSCIKQYFTEV
jgi:hypothetical protein